MTSSATVAPELLPWAPLVAVVADVPMADTRETAELEGQFRGAKLGETVSELLSRALPGPTLLLIEEAHWMDDASADLLRRLLNDLPGRPWFVCVTRRAHDGGFLAPEGVGTTIELAPLDPDVTTELFHLATADAPIPAHELRRAGRALRRSSAVPPRARRSGGGRKPRRGAPRLRRSVDLRSHRPPRSP